MTYLDWTLYDNSARAWLIALGAGLLTFVGLRVLVTLVVRGIERFAGRTSNSIDDIVAEAVRATRGWFLLVVSLRVGALLLVIPDRTRELLQLGVILLLLVQMGVWGRAAIRAHVREYSARRLAEDAASVTTVNAIGFLATVALWSLLLMMGLDNVGIDITALVAGLGVGGIAVALAVQNILGDLFASLSIVLDKPFVYGDFIVVGELAGTVEKVGLKTTRVRSLTGEQLIFANSDLLQSRIRNFKRMEERRVLFTLGVVYQTPPGLVEQIPSVIRQAIESQPELRFDRAHFRAFGASSLDFEVVFFVLSQDYNLYMDRLEKVNLAIMRRFAELGIDFAYPTQTLHVAPGGVDQPVSSPAP